MRFSRRQPFPPLWSQLQQLQAELNRVFDRWSGGSGEAGTATTSYPAVKVWEDVTSAYVEAELPGLDRKDLEIYVTGGNQLTIQGERKPPAPGNAHCHRQEREFGSFVRVLTLPFKLDRDRIDARLENGVLLVNLAKHESAKPRKIIVKSE